MDPFERYKYESEALRKRMQKENRLKITKSNDLKSIRRKPLTDVSNRPVKKSTPNKHIISRNKLLNLHKQFNKASEPVESKFSYSIRDLASHKGENAQIFGVSNRFKSVENEFRRVCITPLDNSGIELFQLFIPLLRVIRWFKINKFDYLIYDPKNELKRKVLDAQKEGNLDELTQEGTVNELAIKKSIIANDNIISKDLYHHVYTRPEFIKNKQLLSPSHSIVKCNRIGKFMYSVELDDLLTRKTSSALLVAVDIRFTPEIDSLIILNKNHSYIHKLGDESLNVYYRWHVYTDNPIDIRLI